VKKNKKAVSLMISYVLLIVIAISMAILVYYWLMKWVPEPPPKCDDDASLGIYDYTIDTVTKTITIVLKNKGRFSIHGYDIKGSSNRSQEAIFPLKYASGEVERQGRYYFKITGIDPHPPSGVSIERDLLKPGRTTGEHVFSYLDVRGINQTIGLQKITISPFIMEDEYIAYCSSSIISLDVGSAAYIP